MRLGIIMIFLHTIHIYAYICMYLHKNIYSSGHKHILYDYLPQNLENIPYKTLGIIRSSGPTS